MPLSVLMATSVPPRSLGVIRGFIYLRAVYSLRAATVADAERLVAAVADGLEVYRSFTPDRWEPPAAETIEGQRERMADADVICLVADDDAGLAGQLTVQPAWTSARSVDEPGLAHLSNLFVRRDRWGSGLARIRHDAALEAARERGFTAMRLFSAAGQARARRFYEREGWAVVGEPWHEDALALDMVEYRRSL
jgi:GNAT superfamily N-acetyltransferase